MTTTSSNNIGDTASETSSTNRPPLDDHTIRSDRSQRNWRLMPQDMTTTTSQQQQGGPQPTPATTMNQESFLKPSPASTTSSLHGRSPPRVIQEHLNPDVLLNTPQREAAQIMTDHLLRSVGVNSSSDSDHSGEGFKRPARPHRPSLQPSHHRETTQSSTSTRRDKGKQVRAWETTDMDVEDPEGRARFEKFMESRNQKFKEMPSDLELRTVRTPVRSPSSNRYRASHVYQQEDDDDTGEDLLANTPTEQRVLNTKQQDLRQASASAIAQPPVKKRIRDEMMEETSQSSSSRNSRDQFTGGVRRRTIIQQLDNVEMDLDVEEENNRRTGFKSPAQFMHLPSPQVHQQEQEQQQDSESDAGAYLFSDTLPQQIHQQQDTMSKRSQSLGTMDSSTEGGGVDRGAREHTGSSYMTMKTGQLTSQQVPAQFSLKYFAPTFQKAPASTHLTKIYQIFDARPCGMLTVQDVQTHLGNDDKLGDEEVQLYIEVLQGKKFLKKVGSRHAWVVRR